MFKYDVLRKKLKLKKKLLSHWISSSKSRPLHTRQQNTETSLWMAEYAEGVSALQRSSWPLLQGRSSIVGLSAKSAGLLNYLDSEWGSASGHVCLRGTSFLSASPFPRILSTCHLSYKYSHKDLNCEICMFCEACPIPCCLFVVLCAHLTDRHSFLEQAENVWLIYCL